MMDVQDQTKWADNEIDMGEYIAIFRIVWWKIVLLSSAVGVVVLLIMLRVPNNYKATAVITPVTDEGRQVPAFGALATLGIVTGTPSKAEDLETLFNSNDLTARVFKKYDLWPIVFPGSYDSVTGKLRISWTDRLFGGDSQSKLPGHWDAIRVAENRLKVTINKKAGTVSVSFESPTAESSAIIVRYYLEEGKSRLQEEALERAGKNKKFIEDQISRTIDPLTKERLFAMYGQEVEREMLARNREQFGFKIIDAPVPPDRKSKPRRALTATLVALLSLPVWTILWLFRTKRTGAVPHTDPSD
jgi:uncharacterized protein involved in exopolysaccharide biosynthesis